MIFETTCEKRVTAATARPSWPERVAEPRTGPLTAFERLGALGVVISAGPTFDVSRVSAESWGDARDVLAGLSDEDLTTFSHLVRSGTA